MTDASHPVAASSTTGLAGLSPAYFGMVMATGIVSIAAQQLGHPWFARALFALNLVAYAVLCLLYLLRALRHRQRFFGDLFDHLRGPGFFTSVAPECCLRSFRVSGVVTVTPDPATIVVCPAPTDLTTIDVPISKASSAFGGTVRLLAVPTFMRM